MPAIDSITVRGFKSIKAIEDLKLGAINVLIGANGSGKSNFIGVFSLLPILRQSALEEYSAKHGGAEKILHFGAKVTPELQIDIRFRGSTDHYRVSAQPTRTDSLAFATEHFSSLALHNSKLGMLAGIVVGEGGNDESRLPTASRSLEPIIQEHFESWRVYHFHDTGPTSPLKLTAQIDDNRFLRADGSNLAAYLYFLRMKHATAYEFIRRTIQQAAPFFDDFQLEPQRLNEQTIKLEWRHKGSDAYFDASSLSDGTLRFIALATLFLQPAELRPSLILVDEPEIGLHPYAITLLASMIKKASVDTQVIVSTQSPTLLDHFEPEDVLVADRVDGGTQLHRLDSTRLSAWLEEYSLGQLWEKNELGGRPSAE